MLEPADIDLVREYARTGSEEAFSRLVARHLNLQTNAIAATIAINLLITFSISNIDWRGHVGGLITGCAVALVIAYAPRGPHRDRVQAAGVAVIAVVLVAGGVLAAHHVKHKCPVLHTVDHGVPIACTRF